MRTLVGSGVLVLPVLEELEELLGSPLLEEAHTWTLDRLDLIAGNLRDLALTVDKAASDLLELEVTSDFSVDENSRELARSDDEFGDEIDSVVAVATKVLRRRGAIPELAVEL